MADDISVFPYLVRIESRRSESGQWRRHIECPTEPELFGESDSLTDAFAQLEARYVERFGTVDSTYRVDGVCTENLDQ